LLALVGVLQYAINYVLIYLSEGYLTSGLVAIIFVVIVVWNMIGGRVFFGRRISALLAGGALLGILGVALVFWPEVAALGRGQGQLVGALLAVGATLAGSAGNLLSEHLYSKEIGVAPSTAWAMFYASASVALYCLVRGVPFTFDATPSYLVSLLYLSLFGSVLAFLGFLTLLRRIGAGRAGYMAAVIPAIAMGTSTFVEGYAWTLPSACGVGLILAGNVMVLRGKRRASGT
jgi:drug/metabolite transporter (DMT)-like permease